MANLLGRTPSSVGLKMANLAHFDKELRARNVSGMSNASKLDGEIFREFESDWDGLSYQAQEIKARLRNTAVENVICDEVALEIEKLPLGEYRDQVMRSRVGQYFFRTAVLSAYRNRCCITGIVLPELLVASHIKPWKNSDAKTERTNPSNG